MKQLQIEFANAYLLVHVFSSIDANNGCNALSLLSSHGIVQELCFHCSVVLDFSWLIHASAESLGARRQGRFTVSLTIHVFRLYSCDISTVSYRSKSYYFYISLKYTNLEFVFLARDVAKRLPHGPL